MLILILAGPVIGYIIAYSWPIGKFMEQRERIKKAFPKRKVRTLGDIGWETYLSDVNDCRE